MKKLLSLILCAIVLTVTMNAQNIMLSTGSKGITRSNDRFTGFQAKFSYDQIESTTITGTAKGTFSAITIAGAYLDGEFGTPGLPVFRKMIAVPVGATPKIKVKGHSTAEYRLDDYEIHTLFPMQPDVRKDQDPNTIPFRYDEKAYSANAYNSADIAEVGVIGTMRGLVIGMVVIRPVQYNPVSNTIMVYNDIDVEVTFENGDYRETEELYTKTYSPYFENVYGIVFNEGVHRDFFDDHPDLYTAPVRMLVIAHRSFEATLQPWIEWKTQKGFYMDVNYTDNIGTTAAAIKTFCHNKYNSGIGNGTAPTFIVIVGDTPQVPASQTGSSSGKATDLYYASVNSDYFPEMYYSRMSAQTTAQLENIIEKILYYEKYQFADPSFLDNVLLIAGADATWNPRVGQPSINYAANYYYNAANGYANIHKYLNSYSGCYANFNNVGFANYTAHCLETGWGDPSFNNPQIASLTNLNKYFVAMGNCCLAGDFGFGECFGEAMIRAQKKGAVGYIGSSPNSYWGDDFHFAVGAYSGNLNTVTNPTLTNTTVGVYDLIFRDADFNCLSSHVFAGNLAVTYAHVNPGYEVHTSSPWYYWEAYNVLGDGSLMPYNTQADDNTVSHLPIVPIGLPSYEVSALPGSYAAISKDGVLHGVAIADATGVANVVLDPPILSGGDVDIVVTRNQYKPYIAQVPAAALSGPYVIFGSYSTANPLTYISENTGITVSLKNVGVDPTEGALTVTISCADPQLTINSATATCAAINADETADVNFNVSVANDIPDNKTFSVTVIVEDVDNTVWESRMSLKAFAPDFSLEKVLINGIEGGNLEPGAIVTLAAVVKNKGNADAFAVSGEITTTSPYITPACSEANAATQNLPAGESMTLTFVVVADQSMPYGHEANLELLLAAQYGRTYTAPFQATCSNYCVPGTTNCNSGDRFTSVQLIKTSSNTILINNTNGTCGTNGYSDFTNLSADLIPGQQYTIKVRAAYSSNYVRGWFDLNGNKTFDASEQLISVTCNAANTEYAQTFTVPQTAIPGTHRFRLRTIYNNSNPNACDGYTYGQTHDYAVVVAETYPRVQNVVAALSGSNITINWEAPDGGTPESYNIYRNGIRLNTTLLTNTTFTETGLSEGVYVYNVTAVFAGNNESMAQMSNVVCFAESPLCVGPVNLSAYTEINTVILNWDDSDSMSGVLLGYDIYCNGSKINTSLVTAQEYRNENLTNGTYTYQVVSVYDNGCESPSASITMVIELYAVNYQSPQNGSLSVMAGTAAIANGTLVNVGSLLSITATPDDKYLLETLTVNGSNFTSGNNHTVTGVTTIEAAFRGIDATLTNVSINGNDISNISDDIPYMASCGEDNIVLNLNSEGPIKVNGTAYTPGMTVPFNNDKLTLHIEISGVPDRNYTLNISKALGSSAMPMYVQRWGKTLAVVNNPDYNGGHTFDNYQWYRQGLPLSGSNNGYILLDGWQAESYSADAHSTMTASWHKLCHNVREQAQTAITVYPNPVGAGQLLNLNLPDNVNNVNVNIYSINGSLVRQEKGVHTAVTMPNQTGMYVIEIHLPDGTKDIQQVIVQ